MTRISSRSCFIAAAILGSCTQVFAKYAWQTDAHWVDTWTSMPQLAELYNLPSPPYVRLFLLSSNIYSRKIEPNRSTIRQLHNPPNCSSLLGWFSNPHPDLQRIWNNRFTNYGRHRGTTRKWLSRSSNHSTFNTSYCDVLRLSKLHHSQWCSCCLRSYPYFRGPAIKSGCQHLLGGWTAECYKCNHGSPGQ